MRSPTCWPRRRASSSATSTARSRHRRAPRSLARCAAWCHTRTPTPRAFTLLVERGYRPLYLSARPEWLTERTREFLGYHGFPMGAVRVTEGERGASGDDAVRFKSAELARLASEGLVPSFGFGNKPSDTLAYEAAHITPASRRVFYRLTDTHGGRRIEGYGELLPELARLPGP